MVKCNAGFFSNAAADECQICPEDFYCPSSGTSVPLACPKGYTCPNKDTDWSVFGQFANVYQDLLPEGGTANYSRQRYESTLFIDILFISLLSRFDVFGKGRNERSERRRNLGCQSGL